MKGAHAVTLVLLTLIEEKCAQTTAIITPRNGYNASLDPEANFTFQCDVTGADSVLWLVDGLLSTRQDIRNHGISESDVIIVDEATGSFRAYISLSRNVANRNTTIICIADIVLSAGVASDPVLFQVQGFLDTPSHLTLSEANNQHERRLSWDEPFSLDITDVDPDITHYKVCYTLINAEKLSLCTHVNQTEYTFLYVSLPLLFTVSAVNVVGEGNSSSILLDHEAANCNRGLMLSNFMNHLSDGVIYI